MLLSARVWLVPVRISRMVGRWKVLRLYGHVCGEIMTAASRRRRQRARQQRAPVCAGALAVEPFVSALVADVDPAQPRAPRRADPLPDDAAGIERPDRTEAVPTVPVSPMRGRGRVGGERGRAERGGGSERKRQLAQHWEFLLL